MSAHSETREWFKALGVYVGAVVALTLMLGGIIAFARGC